MRIVQYHPRALVGDGGISNSVRRLSAAMVEAGAEVVIAHQPSEHESDWMQDAGGAEWRPVPHIGPARFPVPVDLDDVLADADVLILNSAWTVHNAAAALAGRRARVPYVLSDRGAYDPLILQRRRWTKRSWWHVVERHVVRRAAGAHVFFEEQGANLEKLGFTGQLIVAPNGVVVPSDARWDGGSGGYLLYLGRFDPEHKGLDLIIHATASLPASKRPQIRLHGPDWRGGKSATAELVETLGLSPWIAVGEALYGDAKWASMTASSGFLYPSRWEGFGNSAAEAAALGIPLVVTPYPLGRFLAGHGLAVLAEPTVSSIAAALLDVLKPSGEHAVETDTSRIRGSFTWPRVAEAWLEQLERLHG